jgi:hypothetical protein
MWQIWDACQGFGGYVETKSGYVSTRVLRTCGARIPANMRRLLVFALEYRRKLFVQYCAGSKGGVGCNRGIYLELVDGISVFMERDPKREVVVQQRYDTVLSVTRKTLQMEGVVK